MGEALVVAGPVVEPLGGAVGAPPQPILKAGLPLAQHHVPGLEPRELALGLRDEVDALLLDEPRHHPDQRQGGRVRKPALRDQRLAVHALALQAIAIVMAGDQRVAGRIPFHVVDPVQEPEEVGAATREHAFEAEAELAVGLDLARIGRAHRREEVRERQPDLHVVHPPPELERARGVEHVAPEAGERQHPRVVDALIAEVVDGEHRCGRGEGRGGALVRAEEAQRPCCLVVVGVENLDRLPQRFQPLERGAGEEQKALGVVGMAFACARVVVDARPVEEGGRGSDG